MYASEKDVNAAATFMPMTDGGATERPCIEIAGVQVYAYFEDGLFKISLNVDFNEAYPEFMDGDELPYRFYVNGEEEAGDGEPLLSRGHPHDHGDYSDVQ